MADLASHGNKHREVISQVSSTTDHSGRRDEAAHLGWRE